ncbi:protein of unknown function [Trichlorobacter ammonificans]|uniref:Uncharacterized protein n=1 Tax=Trichlorobacter ammonificans TaxID=2916410 RepID=A0ABN8HJD5_9BACT|nr:protein of unknown function [Trichlorobacter ammonificans]
MQVKRFKIQVRRSGGTCMFGLMAKFHFKISELISGFVRSRVVVRFATALHLLHGNSGDYMRVATKLRCASEAHIRRGCVHSHPPKTHNTEAKLSQIGEMRLPGSISLWSHLLANQ